MAEQQDPPVCLQDLQENSCPQSQQTDPDQSLALAAERLDRIDLQTEDQAETPDVQRDVCTVRTEKPMNSCPVCSAPYGDTHLRINTDRHTGEVTEELHCSKHHRPLEVFCRTDQLCICYPCILDEHRGHDVVLAATERAEKQQMQLDETKKKVKNRETELNEMKKAAAVLQSLSQATEEEGDRIFTQLLSCVQKSHTEMITLVQNKMSTEMDRIQRHVEGLEQKISELKKKHSELEQLSHTEDHVTYLQKVLSLRSTSEHEDVFSLTSNPQFSFGGVIHSLSSLTAQIQNLWTLEISRIFSAVKEEQVLLPSEPKTRKDLLQFLVPLTLDPNTAHKNLCLTEQNRAVACSTESQPYPEHPERFEWWAQVLASEGLTGRCYWEVVWSGQYGVDIAVAYRDISRTGEGDDSGFGYNRNSWSLDCSVFRCALVHCNVETEIVGTLSHRIGVYLDHRAGLLSFYSICDDVKLLHRVRSRFTRPVYPGFGLFQGSTAKFCGPE